jgi:hypothetical protein
MWHRKLEWHGGELGLGGSSSSNDIYLCKLTSLWKLNLSNKLRINLLFILVLHFSVILFIYATFPFTYLFQVSRSKWLQVAWISRLNTITQCSRYWNRKGKFLHSSFMHWIFMEITSATIYSNLFFPFHSSASSALGKNRRIWTRTTLTKYYIINYKCISGLPSFLWPRFPLTHNKPVVGHASTVITSEVGEGSGRTGTCKPHDSRTSFGGSWG